MHDLFCTGGRGGEKHRFPLAVKAFLACSTEVIAHVERRSRDHSRSEGRRRDHHEDLDGWTGAGAPYEQTEHSVGGVSMSSLKTSAAWKAWLCQLVKNLAWALQAASELCVA